MDSALSFFFSKVLPDSDKTKLYVTAKYRADFQNITTDDFDDKHINKNPPNPFSRKSEGSQAMKRK